MAITETTLSSPVRVASPNAKVPSASSNPGTVVSVPSRGRTRTGARSTRIPAPVAATSATRDHSSAPGGESAAAPA
ncbi:MAG: hypothetical protein L0I24_04405 [Pseudonocardia sp.]|nr:hypothetical protein [Pseudonocardia sp.]